jgi:formate dehydrogenase subunit gamma
MHWAVAVPFMVSYLTALILVVFYNRTPGRPYRELVSLIHRVSGIGLIVLPLCAVARNWDDYRMHLYNIRQAWVWTLPDLKWLCLMGPATLNKKIELPHQGKFNAAEKINFMVLTWTYPLYVITGLLIWLPGVALVAWLLHFSMAMFATPLLLGHIFMATINPDTRVGLQGMITGFVDRHWAKHHYRLWFDENFVTEAEPAVEVEVPLYAAAAADAGVAETVAARHDMEGTDESDGEEPTLPPIDARALSTDGAPWPDLSQAAAASALQSTKVGDDCPGCAA